MKPGGTALGDEEGKVTSNRVKEEIAICVSAGCRAAHEHAIVLETYESTHVLFLRNKTFVTLMTKFVPCTMRDRGKKKKEREHGIYLRCNILLPDCVNDCI